MGVGTMGSRPTRRRRRRRRRLLCGSCSAVMLFTPTLAEAQSQSVAAPASTSGAPGRPSGTASTSATSALASAGATGTAAAVPTATLDPFIPTGTTPGSDLDNQREGLLNYYFIFIALAVIFLGLCAWLFHRRRRRLKARSQSRGRSALARDLHGWRAPRRWMHGRWRSVSHGIGLLPHHFQPARRPEHEPDEGVDEHGEPPPPYEPMHGRQHSGAALPPVTIPLRTLSRDGPLQPKPPDYHSVAVPSTDPGGRS